MSEKKISSKIQLHPNYNQKEIIVPRLLLQPEAFRTIKDQLFAMLSKRGWRIERNDDILLPFPFSEASSSASKKKKQQQQQQQKKKQKQSKEKKKKKRTSDSKDSDSEHDDEEEDEEDEGDEEEEGEEDDDDEDGEEDDENTDIEHENEEEEDAEMEATSNKADEEKKKATKRRNKDKKKRSVPTLRKSDEKKLRVGSVQELRAELGWSIFRPSVGKRVRIFLLSNYRDVHRKAIKLSSNEDAIVVYDMKSTRDLYPLLEIWSTKKLAFDFSNHRYIRQLSFEIPDNIDAVTKKFFSSKEQIPTIGADDAIFRFFDPDQLPPAILFTRLSQISGTTPYLRILKTGK